MDYGTPGSLRPASRIRCGGTIAGVPRDSTTIPGANKDFLSRWGRNATPQTGPALAGGGMGLYNRGIMIDAHARSSSVRRALRRVPMAPVALAMAGGIVAGRYGPLSATVWGVWAGVALGAAGGCLLRKWRLPAAVAVGLAVFALGAMHVRLRRFHLPDQHVVTYTGRSGTMATIRGRIVSSPAVYSATGAVYPRDPTTRFDLEAGELLIGERWQPVEGLVQASILQQRDDLTRGQRVQLVGWISRIRPPDNPGQRDLAAAARRAGKFVEFRVPLAEGVEVLDQSTGPGHARVRDRANAWARGQIHGWAPGPSALMAEALIVGRRDPSLGPLRDTMARAGIAHLMSISGMHLGIFLGFVYLLCRLATLSPSRSAAIALLCLTGYLLLAEPRSPLLRSAVMAAVLCAGVIVHRRHMALNALALAGVGLLIADPMELFSPGFQLSFTIVAGLIVFNRPLRDLLFGRWIRERGLMVFRRERSVRRWLYFTGANWAMGAVTMSLLAWLLAAPLGAVHFGLFSPFGAPLTLLAAPLIVAVIVPGYVSLAVVGLAPNLAHLLGRAACASAGGLIRMVEAFEHIPALHFQLQPVGAVWAAVCYVAIVVVVLHRSLVRGRIWAAAACACVLAVTTWTQLPAAPTGVAELNVLAVGAGQCAVLRTAEGRTVILDAGSLGRADCGEQILVPFLLHEGLPGPDAAILSHANADHYNALPALLGRGWVRTVYLNEYFGRPPETQGASVRRLMGDIRARSCEVRRLQPGRKIALDGRTHVEVLWPPPERADLTVNDRSLVLRITCDGRSVLVPGDLDQIGQAALTATPSRIRSDVLILPHHGGWESTLPAFVAAVAPKTTLVSAAREPVAPLSAGPPAKAFYTRLAVEYDYYSTLRNGWIQIRFGKNGVEVETMRE